VFILLNLKYHGKFLKYIVYLLKPVILNRLFGGDCQLFRKEFIVDVA